MNGGEGVAWCCLSVRWDATRRWRWMSLGRFGQCTAGGVEMRVVCVEGEVGRHGVYSIRGFFLVGGEERVL